MFKRLSVALFLVASALSGCESFNHLNVTFQQLPDNKFREVAGETKMVVSGVTEIVPPAGQDPRIIKAPPVTPPDDKGPIEAEKLIRSLCQVYHPPVLPPEPAAPYEKLSQLAPTDIAGIDALVRAHIVELHLYINTTQATLAKSYHDYALSCDSMRKKYRPKM
jgi:hypothetical protein